MRLAILLSVMFLSAPLAAAPSTYLDVCTSGCAFNDVQAAIDSITDSGKTRPYTIFIEAGVLSVDSDITLSGKDYINFVGHGPGASVIEASAEWFSDTSTGDLLTIANASHLTFRGITIDALENDDGSHNVDFAAVITTDCDEIVMDDMELRASVYAWWHRDLTPDNGRFRTFNSEFFARHYALVFDTGIWHFFGSNLRAVNDGSKSQQGGQGNNENAFSIQQRGGILVVWGSHLHAEASTAAGLNQVIAYRMEDPSPSTPQDREATFVGTTLHAKLAADAPAFVETIDLFNGLSEIHLVGSELLYESPEGDGQGGGGGGHIVVGLGYRNTAKGTTVDITSSDFIDGGGVNNPDGSFSIPAARADLAQLFSCGGRPNRNDCQPRIRTNGTRLRTVVDLGGKPIEPDVASLDPTTNMQSGTATFLAANSVLVTLPVELPSTDYQVFITGSTLEGFWVSNKTTTGFTINSSAPGGSSAAVDWLMVR